MYADRSIFFSLLQSSVKKSSFLGSSHKNLGLFFSFFIVVLTNRKMGKNLYSGVFLVNFVFHGKSGTTKNHQNESSDMLN